MQQLDLYVANLDCDHDAARLRRELSHIDGLQIDRLMPSAGRLLLSFDPTKLSPGQMTDRLRLLGFPPRAARDADPPRPWRNPKVLAAAASGVLLLVGWLLSLAGTSAAVSLACYALSILTGAYYFAREAFGELLYERKIGIELLMTVAAIVAAALGEWGEAAMLAFLYSISEALEGYTEARTRSAVRALMKLAPRVALVRRGGGDVEIPIEELQVGEIFLVRPGQAVPTDGEVLRGTSSVNQAPVTGESVPVEKEPGHLVFAGSINEEGSLEIRATKTAADNTIARIIQLVEEAQERKANQERLVERFGARYSPAVLLTALAIGIVPPLVSSIAWHTAIGRATVFLVAAAPCALVISIPITIVAALGIGARHGVLIKGGVFVELLAQVKVVALDKTGTVTRGLPRVTDFMAAADTATGEDDILALAAGIESRSQHPIARSIVEYATERGIAAAEPDSFRSLTGAGATATFRDRSVRIGKPGMFTESGRSLPAHLAEAVTRMESAGKTVVLIGSENEAWALFAVQDELRANARAAIEQLHDLGLKPIVMLTGDNERTARAVAAQAGVDEVYADLSPEDKVARIRDLTTRHGTVAMIGDGVNDAPALAEASVGVAMGAAGTDVALETADVALMSDNLERLAYGFHLARRTRNIIRQNLLLSVAVITVLTVGALSGTFGLPIAVLGHELSELLVIANGLRVLNIRPRSVEATTPSGL